MRPRITVLFMLGAKPFEVHDTLQLHYALNAAFPHCVVHGCIPIVTDQTYYVCLQEAL